MNTAYNILPYLGKAGLLTFVQISLNTGVIDIMHLASRGQSVGKSAISREKEAHRACSCTGPNPIYAPTPVPWYIATITVFEY